MKNDVICVPVAVKEGDASVKTALDGFPDHAHKGCYPASPGNADHVFVVE